MKKLYMAVDQFGTTYHGLEHPRKDLCERLGYATAKKMYIDEGGKTYHTGYVIGGAWLDVYEVKPMRKEIK